MRRTEQNLGHHSRRYPLLTLPPSLHHHKTHTGGLVEKREHVDKISFFSQLNILDISSFIMGPKRERSNSESLVPKRKRVVITLTEKVKILDKLRSGVGASAAAHVFGLNESTIRCIPSKESEIRPPTFNLWKRAT